MKHHDHFLLPSCTKGQMLDIYELQNTYTAPNGCAFGRSAGPLTGKRRVLDRTSEEYGTAANAEAEKQLNLRTQAPIVRHHSATSKLG